MRTTLATMADILRLSHVAEQDCELRPALAQIRIYGDGLAVACSNRSMARCRHDLQVDMGLRVDALLRTASRTVAMKARKLPNGPVDLKKQDNILVMRFEGAPPLGLCVNLADHERFPDIDAFAQTMDRPRERLAFMLDPKAVAQLALALDEGRTVERTGVIFELGATTHHAIRVSFPDGEVHALLMPMRLPDVQEVPVRVVPEELADVHR